MKLSIKIVLSVVATAVICFGGAIALLIASFAGSSFYIALTVAGIVIVWLLLLMVIWGWLRPKVRLIVTAAALGALLLAIAGYEAAQAYHQSIPTVNEQGVDLSLYDPFRQDTLAAALQEPSTLRLTGDLPRLDGATALYPLYSAFVRAVYPADYNGPDQKNAPDGALVPEKVDDILACTNTDGAYRRLIAGDADIIFVAGPSEEQMQMAREAGVELRLTPIGREAFVFFVNAQNPVDGISTQDIRRIYSGEATNWRELGGNNAAIRAFQRPANSGSQTALVRFLGDTPLMTPPTEDVAGGMGDIINRVSSYRNYDNAIGYSFLFFATQMVRDEQIKLLAIDGVAPERENVASGTYPFAAEFYAVTAGTENPNAQRLIEWVLSSQGQFLVAQTGYTPMAGVAAP